MLAENPDNAGYFRDRTSARYALADVLQRAGRKAEACRSYDKARAEFDEIEARWGVDALLRKHDVALIKQALLACAGFLSN